MYLQNAEIQNFRGIRHLKVDFDQDTTVLLGENAWGKSSLLYALFMILGRGEEHLCSFSADDLYIPIRLDTDEEDGAGASASAGAAGSELGADSSATSSPEVVYPSPNTSASSEIRVTTASGFSGKAPKSGSKAVPQSDSEIYAQAAQKELASTPSMSAAALAHIKSHSIESFLQKQGLTGIEPLKIIHTKNYQRRYYRVPKGDGTYMIHIVDLPTNVEKMQEGLKAALKLEPRDAKRAEGAGSSSSSVSAAKGSTNSSYEAKGASLGASDVPQARPQIYLDALSSFLAPEQHSIPPLPAKPLPLGMSSLPRAASLAPLASSAKSEDASLLSAALDVAAQKAAEVKGSHGDGAEGAGSGEVSEQEAMFAALRRGQDAEAQYERAHPVHYAPSRSELMQRAQNVLLGRGLLEQEAIESAQDDVAFYQSDVYTSKVERIVIDLIFCESAYGVINKVERFAPLKPACFLGDDGLYRIHYRVSAFQQSQSSGQSVFVTRHELLNARGEAIDNASQIIRELIILNPLLRLRDRRMLKPHLDPQESLYPEDSNELYTSAAQVKAAGAQMASDSCDLFAKVQAAKEAVAQRAAGAGAASASADSAEGASEAEGSAGRARRVDERDLQAISHFFTDIAIDDDFTSRQIKDGIEVLNTIASKYLINYQSNNLSTAYEHIDAGHNQRTARDIISHPVSLGSLRSLKQALSDNKPSRAKFLLSLLAGALLMSRGQREIDEYSRPILILEDIEGRFHPTLLLNLWAILQLLPIQKIVTTNSAQLLTAVPMSKLRRLCKQYYDVRCYSMRDRAFSEDDARKIAFHIRMNRPSTLFARCWILVEGETEVWVLNEIANALDFNLGCSGVAIVEFAQCGLNPLIKLAKQLGIAYHVLTDGDDAGRHYAQIVCDFVGSENLPDHLSVMPHVDIEHYLYTSGFADVYQKAAGLTLNTPKYRFLNGALQNMGFSARDAKLWATQGNKLDRVIFSEPKAKSKDNSKGTTSDASAPAASEAAVALGAQAPKGSSAKGAAGKRKRPEWERVGSGAAAAQLKKQLAQDHLATHINSSDYALKNHNLESVVKTVLHYNLGKNRSAISKIVNRGRIQGISKKAVLLDISEVSRGDINNFYQYAHNLLMTMPRQHKNLSKRHRQLLNALKNERSLWLAVVNQNQQRLNKKLRQAQAVAKQVAEQQYQEQLQSTSASASGAGAETSAASEAAQASSSQGRPALELGGGSAPCGCEGSPKGKRGGARDASGDESVPSANDLYGALNQKELSRQGMSMSKVIDKAIHKKTKPGMAILVSEAILQRGAGSVPQLFTTLFCKVKRLAQNELPFD